MSDEIMIEDLIAQNVKVIGVVPNDAKVLEPVLTKAREKGIIVITHESPSQKGADVRGAARVKIELALGDLRTERSRQDAEINRQAAGFQVGQQVVNQRVPDDDDADQEHDLQEDLNKTNIAPERSRHVGGGR